MLHFIECSKGLPINGRYYLYWVLAWLNYNLVFLCGQEIGYEFEICNTICVVFMLRSQIAGIHILIFFWLSFKRLYPAALKCKQIHNEECPCTYTVRVFRTWVASQTLSDRSTLSYCRLCCQRLHDKTIIYQHYNSTDVWEEN